MAAAAGAMLVLALLCGAYSAESSAMTVNIENTVLNTVMPQYRSFNIDLSSNRGFFWRTLNTKNLTYLAGQLSPAVLRVGGTGGDYLTYALNKSHSCHAKKDQYCLNATRFDDLMDFANQANLPVVFGLNIMKRTSDQKQWDPTEARELIQYSLTKNYTFFGFELGNEQNHAFKGADEAHDFLILQKLLQELYPVSDTRPRIIGPDPHSFHGPDPSTISFLEDFMDEATKIGLELHAVTHHEYVEMENGTWLSSKQLDLTAAIAVPFNASVANHYPTAQPWGGEIGPHNGGEPPCNPAWRRWANFADSFWYLDALATKAVNGYKVFCRQDLIGADYGLLDCATQVPTPDYYAAVLWGRLMGQNVLRTSNSDSDSQLRSYAHCSTAGKGAVTVLLLNLDSTNTVNVTVALPSGAKAHTRTDYHVTAPVDLLSLDAALNNVTLVLQSDGTLPSLVGTTTADPTADVSLAPASWAFVEYTGVDSICQGP